MNNRVLITYATKYGSTGAIAVKIGNILREADFEVDVIPVENVEDIYPYRAVIVGSAVYMGQWRTEMVKFLKDKQSILSEKSVWIFSSGPTGEGDPHELMKGWQFPGKLEPVLDVIQPESISVFHGELNLNKLNMLEKFIVNNVKAPAGDFRDWRMITDWAQQIVCDLKNPQPIQG